MKCDKEHDCCKKCDCCSLDIVMKWLKERWTLFAPLAMLLHGVFNDNCYTALAGLGVGAILIELHKLIKMVKNCCWY